MRIFVKWKPDSQFSVKQQTFQVFSVEGEGKRGRWKRGSLKSSSWLSRQVDTLQQQDLPLTKNPPGAKVWPRKSLSNHGFHDELQQN